MEASSSAEGSTGRFGVDGMLPLPLLARSWCATFFALTRHGGLDVFESFDSFLIVFHTLQLLCVILVNVMTSSHLFSYTIWSISLFPDAMIPRQNGCSCMLYVDFLIGQFDRERIMFDILFVCSLFSPTGVFRCIEKNYICLFA